MLPAVHSILKQGRRALVVTIQAYKILALNGLIRACSLAVQYLHGIRIGNRQKIIAGLSTGFCTFCISRTKVMGPPPFYRDTVTDPSLAGQEVITGKTTEGHPQLICLAFCRTPVCTPHSHSYVHRQPDPPARSVGIYPVNDEFQR